MMRNSFIVLLLLATLLLAKSEDYKRGADQTYLTYPEWFLVFSPEEYAYYLKDNPSYEFNYIGHLVQFWSGYAMMRDRIESKGYATNIGYHVMILTIGISTTVEYTIKFIYGKTVSQLAALTQSQKRVSEQDYGAKVAQEYVDFIKNRPWYEFDFASKFVGIYTKNSFFGEDFLRKLERKEALSVEYGVKFLYAKLIGFFTKVGYDEALPVTQVTLVKGDKQIIEKFPRYDKFKNESLHYAKEGYNFVNIAGNDANSSILYSLVGEKEKIDSMECMLKTPILSNRSYSRCVNDIEIAKLSDFLRNENFELTEKFLPVKGTIKLEHIFDF
jgi:hypothetical protein